MAVHDIPTLFIYAFDPRTRLGPFMYFDKNLMPGAPRAIGTALYEAGFRKLRVVHQAWNPQVLPSEARIDGQAPELLLISSMQIHSASAYQLIRDAWRLGPDRPLIFVGGPKAVYEPWDFFGLGPDGSQGADVAVTGEEFVLLELLDCILEQKSPQETIREAFERVRRVGALDEVPGLVFRANPGDGPPEALIDTGPQRLVHDLDELPLPTRSLGLFEPPHPRTTLSPRPLPAEKLGRYLSVLSILSTRGCRFRCHYCPIPAYNQFSFRSRSAESLIEEIRTVKTQTGISRFFGADDNFFNDRSRLEKTFETMARADVGGVPFRDSVLFSTEATVYDVFENRDLLPLARDAGLRALWIGVEDLTAKLVKKGQGPEKTKAVFRMLAKADIAPMAMIIHHDGQPLWSWRGLYGLLNQVGFLRRAGALTCQITMLTPSVGSKSYEPLFREGKVLSHAGGLPVEDYQFDGNHCVATTSESPWLRQLNLFAGYAAFYNPLNMLRALARLDGLWQRRVRCQVLGMLGIAQSLYQASGWIARLVSGPVERHTSPPEPKFRVLCPCPVKSGS